jgi:small-conductance mechanosensitive channel
LRLLGTLPIIKIFIIIFLTAYILTQVLNFPHATLVAILASAGLAIGIGAMDIVKNMFGGAVVILSRPFQIGDRITINEHYGEVVDIRFLHTRIKQIDNALVSIPNSLFISKEVKNQNYGSIDCPIIIDFWIPGDSDPKQVKKLLYEATITSKYVNLDKRVIIYIDDVIKQVQIQHYKIKVYVFDTSYEFDFRTDVTEVVKQKLHDMGFPLYTGEDRRFVGHDNIYKD